MGLRVKEILKDRGMTMIELSEKLGIVNDTLTRNLKNPQLRTLERIADALEVDVSELFEQPDNSGTIGIIRHNGESYEINSIADIEKLLEQVKMKE